MQIIDEAIRLVEDAFTDMRSNTPPSVDERCPHCGVIIRFPLAVRRGDLELFQTLIRSAHRVMAKHGITANLIADIRVQCLIEVAKRDGRLGDGHD